MSAFRITSGKGFHLTFENGWTVSVQFGPGNYCEHRNVDWDKGKEAAERGSPDAEIAAWPESGEMLRFEESNDSVRGWVSPDEVAAFIADIAGREPVTETEDDR